MDRRRFVAGSGGALVLAPALSLAQAQKLRRIGVLAVGSLGNIRTETLTAFSAEEFGKILGKMPG